MYGIARLKNFVPKVLHNIAAKYPMPDAKKMLPLQRKKSGQLFLFIGKQLNSFFHDFGKRLIVAFW